MASQRAIKPGKYLTHNEMRTITEELFLCNIPNVTIAGNPTYIEFKKDYLERMFNK